MLLSPCILPLSFLMPSANDVAPSGAYVEARTASVYAGACHYAGEATTSGREALLAWRIDAGTQSGIDLSGVAVAAALIDDANLADGPHARRSIVYVQDDVAPARKAAACAWLAREHAELLGDVLAVRSVPIRLSIDASGYALASPGAFELAGGPLPDRACCKMPFNVWYAPFEPLCDRLVGNDGEFRFTDAMLGAVWSRPNENAAFVGRFGAK